MKFTVNGLKIAGISAVVPKNTVSSDDIIQEAPIELAADLKKAQKLSGVENRRIALSNQCASDLCFYAAQKLLEELGWDSKEVNILIFISQTPDYGIPGTSYLLQQRLNISKNACVLDINLACSGFTHGIWLASKLLEGTKSGKALLLVGDTLSKVISQDDWFNRMLFGDAGAAIAIEYDKNSPKAFFTIGSDGSGAKSVCSSFGGYRLGHQELGLTMAGFDVFLFAARIVPNAIKELLKDSSIPVTEVDFVIPHQASTIILKNIEAKMNLPIGKMVIDLKNFGNTTSTSIPLALIGIKENLAGKNKNIIFVGFGAGLSWSAFLLQNSDIKILPLLEL